MMLASSDTIYSDSNPLWYKDAVIYQLHVKTFSDSSGDGVGDFRGLTHRLDYLRGLGVTAIWLLPFYPSPLKDDGYDIQDYFDVHPHYGTLKDFKEFLKQARVRGLRVITELVINHTSDQHPWFQRARAARPGSNHRNYYVWSDTPDRYREARVIFKDFESSNWAWDETAKAYYWHRFYSHQPDLNFDHPNVQKEIFRIVDFWFGLGVDGLRLDAVPYLFQREGTNCENLPETYAFLKKLRKHVDAKFKDRMLLAEANQWPEDAVAYFGKGDECQMAFHFPLMPRMYMAVQMEDRFPIIDILEQTPKIPRTCQWAIFLRNHDELTLEMVTDEERDYMYRSYAKDARSKLNLGIRRRLVPLLGNNRRKIELMYILLFSLPGTPIIYYGDEIGMGDNRFLGDRDGVRTPMQWSPDRNAGFSRANPQELYLPVIIDSEFHYESINVETQEGNLSSLLWWLKRVIAMRKEYTAFSQGAVRFLSPENPKVLCFIRQHKQQIILVVINLSRFSQFVSLDLKEFDGYVPKEIFSQSDFPTIRDQSYTLTLGPHNHFWFLLQEPEDGAQALIRQSPRIKLETSWEEIIYSRHLKHFETRILAGYLQTCRWFGGKSQRINAVKIRDIVYLFDEKTRLSSGSGFPLLLIQVLYANSQTDCYLLPVTFVYAREDKEIKDRHPESIICPLTVKGREGYLYDAVFNTQFQRLLFDFVVGKRQSKSGYGQLVGLRGKDSSTMLAEPLSQDMPSQVLKVEQSNTTIVYDNLFILKLFRKLEQGVHPDVEISRCLHEDKGCDLVPPFAGALEYRRPKTDPVTLGILQGWVNNQGDGWTWTCDRVQDFFDVILASKAELPNALEGGSAGKAGASPRELEICARLDPFFLEMVALLGQRAGEMHLHLAQSEDPDFKPEPFTQLYQRSVYQTMGSQARQVLRMLKNRLADLPVELQGEATPILEVERQIQARLRLMMKTRFSAKRIRIHGDFHLGQCLFTGKDFVFFDFEGEPARPLSERRLKRSALKDVAGMIRSFHYAAQATLFINKSVRPEDFVLLEEAADIWYRKVTSVFTKSYRATIGKAAFLPKKEKEWEVLLQVYLLDKALYELGYECQHRPDWLVIPLRGIRRDVFDKAISSNSL